MNSSNSMVPLLSWSTSLTVMKNQKPCPTTIMAMKMIVVSWMEWCVRECDNNKSTTTTVAFKNTQLFVIIIIMTSIHPSVVIQVLTMLIIITCQKNLHIISKSSCEGTCPKFFNTSPNSVHVYECACIARSCCMKEHCESMIQRSFSSNNNSTPWTGWLKTWVLKIL